MSSADAQSPAVTPEVRRGMSTRGYIILGAVLWTALLAPLVGWDIRETDRRITDVARADALSSFNRDLVYRRWVSGKGGVYVPPSADTPPNPYLMDIPNRDVVTTDGMALTLINPAYMTRQVHELSALEDGVQGHITSLDPLRPENAPDPWEREALERFERGEQEVSSVESFRGEPHLRFMRPMFTEAPCLKCHADQGYREGDIRGGISVSVPMAAYLKTARALNTKSGLIHGIVWCLGLAALIALGIVSSKKAEEKRQTEDRLQQSQRLESLGVLAGGIAHDFNNILTAIIGHADLLSMSPDTNDRAQRSLAQIRASSERASSLVRQILMFSRHAPTSVTPLEVREVIEQAVRFLRSVIPASIEIRVEMAPDCGSVLADATQFHQVLVNLGTNAHHAMRENGGVLTIGAEPETLTQSEAASLGLQIAGPYIHFSVSDTGHGMDGPTLRRAFEPFFTTKAPGEGVGLGLAMAHGTVTRFKGAIRIESVVGEGAHFHIYLPHTSVKPIAGALESLATRGGAESVLFVDDEQAVVTIAEATLTRLGYHAALFTDPQAALDAVREAPARFDVLVTDLTMPGLSGLELAEHVRAIRPTMKIIIATGFGQGMVERDGPMEGFDGLLLKPYGPEELARAVRVALDTSEVHLSP